jgi:class 3 adenylate cyclase/tetratricopeptide (TPR) repeat protein
MAMCPSCGEANPEGARFCSTCGSRLRYEGAGPEARKTITVVFADLVGSTVLGEGMDTEALTHLMSGYFERMRPVLGRHGGTVEKFIGDAVVAVFGFPIVHEDDALRAVRAAEEMRSELEELNAELLERSGVALQTRTGVNTGEVLMGALAPGSNFAAGDVMNTAARLQQVAAPGEILLGETTWRLVRGAVEAEPMEPVHVKGRTQPVRAWRLVKVLSVRGRAEVARPSTPFVGREDDLLLLRTAFRNALREASVQLVTVSGEPGLGKSRLVAEFSRFAEQEADPVVWRQGRCLPYGEGITFWALGEIIKAQAGILESDTAGQARDKLRAAVRNVIEEGAEEDWLLERLSALVAADGSVTASDRLEAFTAWRRFLESIASRTPLVVVVEDVHWADAAMLDFVEHLVDHSSGVPILLICTARPELYERRPTWGGGRRKATPVALAPLTDTETARLVEALLSRAALPAQMQTGLLERAGGNPLYAEEFVRMLADRGEMEAAPSGSVSAAGELPATIHALVAARLDTLSLERKRLLQDAAVIGKVFWAGSVASMGGLDEVTVREGLHELARKELVRPHRTSTVAHQAEYTFWHDLVRDVAYGEIPRAARAGKHRAAAQWIEAIGGEDATADRAEILVYHYTEALGLLRASGETSEAQQLESPARRYLEVAGDRARHLDAARAEAHYLRALELAPPETSGRAGLLVKCAAVQRLLGKTGSAEVLVREAVEALRSREDRLGEGEALVELYWTLRDAGRRQDARRTLWEAIDLLEPQGETPELARALVAKAREITLSGQPSEALEESTKAFAMSERLGMQSEAARTLYLIGDARCELGDLRGLDDSREALRRALEYDLDSSVIAAAYNDLSESLSRIEGPKEALEVRQAGIAFSERRGILGDALFMRAATLLQLNELGRWDEALATADAVLAWARPHSAGWVAAGTLSCQARILSLRGNVSEASELVQRDLPLARQIGDPQTLGWVLAVAALTDHLDGHVQRAVGYALEYADVTRVNKSTRFLLQAFTDVLRILIAAGRLSEAEALVAEEAARAVGPRQENSVRTGRALLAEARRDFGEALEHHDKLAERWGVFGNLLERAHALLGAGRCLVQLGDGSNARERLNKARAIFVELGARPLLGETDSWLARAMPQTS